MQHRAACARALPHREGLAAILAGNRLALEVLAIALVHIDEAASAVAQADSASARLTRSSRRRAQQQRTAKCTGNGQLCKTKSCRVLLRSTQHTRNVVSTATPGGWKHEGKALHNGTAVAGRAWGQQTDSKQWFCCNSSGISLSGPKQGLEQPVHRAKAKRRV